MVKVEHRNIAGPGVSNICAAAIGRDIDEVRAPINANRSNYLVVLGVNNADVRRAGVDDVNLILLRISGDSGGLGADRERPDYGKSFERIGREVDDRNCAALAVGDVRVLAVERTVGGERTLVEVIPSGG